MEQAIYFLLLLVFLAGISYIANRSVNRFVEAQRALSIKLEDKLEKLLDKVESLERVTLDGLMTDLHKSIGYKYAESNGEAIRRWLDYRIDYERSSPHLDEDDARAEALEEIFKEIKRTTKEEKPDESETDQKP